MKIYAILDGDGYQIKTVEETEYAYKITWDFETGIMTVADEPSDITIPADRYNYNEMCKKLNVEYYTNYYEGTQLEVGVTATPKKTSQTITPSKGYDGLASITIEATPLETKSATPTTSEQEIVATTSGKIGLSKVTVAAVTSAIDSNIVAENIKNGVTILGVQGTYAPSDEPSDEPSGETTYGILLYNSEFNNAGGNDDIISFIEGLDTVYFRDAVYYYLQSQSNDGSEDENEYHSANVNVKLEGGTSSQDEPFEAEGIFYYYPPNDGLGHNEQMYFELYDEYGDMVATYDIVHHEGGEGDPEYFEVTLSNE